MKRKIKGFTLIELLATIIILAIVLLIAVPSVLNVLDKTKKKAFIANALVASREANSQLSVNALNGTSELPTNGESVVVSISSLKNDDLKGYSGSIRIQNVDDKYYSYITMSDENYSICNEFSEELTPSKIVKSSVCEFEEEEGNDSILVEGNITRIKTDYVNGPVLIEGMTPVIWDANGNLKETTINDENWFDYSASGKKWANAKTKDGSLWVWIPRYAYQITSGYHTGTRGTIAVRYLKDLTNESYDHSKAAPVNQGNNPGSSSMLVVHPAFKFGDEELYGIWIGKFQSSLDDEENLKSIPNANQVINKTVGEFFTIGREVENNPVYGFNTNSTNIDTHMAKDVEWSSASYLSLSIYGSATTIWKNNANPYKTGCAGTSAFAAVSSTCQNEYNTTLGQNASTTGNYYGVYDLSGGVHEVTAGYLSGAASNINKYAKELIDADAKYKDVYVGSSTNQVTNYNANSLYYGNSVYETSSTASTTGSAWNSNASVFPVTTLGIITHGGAAHNNSNFPGQFYFAEVNGSATIISSFREVILVQKGL